MYLDAIDQACARIAPTWPLDQMIAVNPWWELREQPFASVSARLAALAQVQCLMPKEYFAALWQQNDLRPVHLRQAVAEGGVAADEAALLAHIQQPDEGLPHWLNLSDWLDSQRNLGRQMAWKDEIIHQISQFCAAYFNQGTPLSTGARGLYASWLEITRQDRGIAILMGEPDLSRQFHDLPAQADELIATALDELAVPVETTADYGHALLLDINGWASWVAYLRWQDRLQGRDNRLMQELLAIRLAWERVLWQHSQSLPPTQRDKLHYQWRQQLGSLPALIASHERSQQLTWVWQRAAELAYQQALAQQLSQPAEAAPASAPLLQAAFCIDVRSEVLRRALEAQDAGIQTLGFAGFFGLPIAYQPAGTSFSRPQLPGLLAPAVQVTESSAQIDTHTRQARWQAFSRAAPATFSQVETTGLFYAFKLLKDSLFPAKHTHPVNQHGPETVDFQLRRGEQPLSLTEKAALAGGILRAMTLTGPFAPWVLLVGHGSSSRNNPLAAGLDCGACGGQTGEINARVLAQLLNDPGVRAALREQDILIPAATCFIPALHDTTTDDITCFATGEAERHLGTVYGWLAQAGAQARAERAARLGLSDQNPDRLQQQLQQRSRDWSQVRPEWGLANNACFIVAPRQRTRHLHLAGRSFLHDYRWQQDEGFNILELIMTAPMVVTHWINMQYNASVTDNHKYGCGNKVLHNVVGGHLGVFEGNGGDLRIGLPLQSLHDGQQWQHQPLRLSVYIAAPAAAIAGIAERHEAVRHLIDNDWLYLFRLADAPGLPERYYRGQWLPTRVGQVSGEPA